MLRPIKRLVRSGFRMLDIDIHRVSEYEKNKFAWLRDFHIKTVIDIGANVGQFALEVKEFLPDAKIYSFEPIKSCYEKLLRRCETIQGFKGFNMALGDYNGTAMINKNKFSPSSSILEMRDLHLEVFPFTKKTNKEEIIVRKLGDMVEENNLRLYPELLIKMDVQGYEDRVITGGTEIFKKAKVVITEVSYYEFYEGQVLFDVIYSLFRDMGFNCKGTFNNSFHPAKGTPIFADAVFIRE